MSLAQVLAPRTPHIEVLAPSPATGPYLLDAGTRTRAVDGAGRPDGRVPADRRPRSRSSSGPPPSSASPWSRAEPAADCPAARSRTGDQLVVSTDRLDRILEVSPLDEIAVVEPGVRQRRPQHAPRASTACSTRPTPASFDISTLGGNVATNAGGLRCAKYGVTRESVLALDVVLADGSLISVGHRSIKGVTGLDLVSLFVGSEGVLGIVVRATLRLRPIPVARRTLTAFFAERRPPGRRASPRSPCRRCARRSSSSSTSRRCGTSTSTTAQTCGSAGPRSCSSSWTATASTSRSGTSRRALSAVGGDRAAPRGRTRPSACGTCAATAVASGRARRAGSSARTSPCRGRCCPTCTRTSPSSSTATTCASRPCRTPATATCTPS